MVAASIAVAVSLTIVADRTGAAMVEHQVAGRLRCLTGVTGELKVTVGGFPVLTQLVRRTISTLRVRTGTVTFRDTTLNSIDVTAHGVRLPSGGAISVTRLSVETVITYSGLTTILSKKREQPSGSGFDLADAQFGGDDAGRLTITTTLPWQGRSLPATIYADLAVSGGTLRITPEELELTRLGLRIPASRLPAGAADARTVDLPDLPAGFAYRKIAATSAGLRVTVTGSGLRGDLGTTGTGAAGTGATETRNNCGGTAG